MATTVFHCDDIIRVVLTLLPFRDAATLCQVHANGAELGREMRAKRIRSLLFSYVGSEIETFRSVLLETEAVIAGSCSWLMFDLHANTTTKNLNIFTPSNTTIHWMEFWLRFGYQHTYQAVDDGQIYSAQSQHRFARGARVVELTESNGKTVLPLVLSKEFTSQTNFVSATQLVSVHPQWTINLSCLMTRDIPSSSIAAEAEANHRECGARCPGVKRMFGDQWTASWSWCDHDQHRDVYSLPWREWWVRQGLYCYTGPQQTCRNKFCRNYWKHAQVAKTRS
jgi:hypothetical protein